MLFACSCHIADVRVMCWRAWWPEQPAAFPQGWHVHYALTTGTASVRGPVQPKTRLWQRLSLSLSLSPALVSPGTISLKISCACLNFLCIISIGVMGAAFMKHAEGPREPSTFWPLLFQLVAAKLSRRQIKCTVMWYYRIYYRSV